MTAEKIILDKVRPIVEQYREKKYFPSACVRVFNSRETLAVICAGEAEEGSVFDVASLTKIATATQVLFLIDEGRLDLNAPLTDLFSEIREDEYLTKDSEKFHSHMGYTKVGEFHKCGYKFGRWYNMIWMEKIIGEHA